MHRQPQRHADAPTDTTHHPSHSRRVNPFSSNSSIVDIATPASWRTPTNPPRAIGMLLTCTDAGTATADWAYLAEEACALRLKAFFFSAARFAVRRVFFPRFAWLPEVCGRAPGLQWEGPEVGTSEESLVAFAGAASARAKSRGRCELEPRGCASGRDSEVGGRDSEVGGRDGEVGGRDGEDNGVSGSRSH